MAPLLLDGHRPYVGAVVSFTDVSRTTKLELELQNATSELEAAYEDLQSTIEELETTNEDLQSTNEELETMNEDLQSTNEELETMNEELQSTNEELHDVNIKLQERTTESAEAGAYLASILASVHRGVVVVDGETCVRVWNNELEELWGLRSDEVMGQPLFDLDFGLPLELAESILRAAVDGEHGSITLNGHDRVGRALRCSVTVRH